LTGKAIEKMESKMGTMILNDEMSTLEFADYLDSGEWMGIGSAYFIGPSMNYEIYEPIPEVIALRDKLFEKYKKEIEAGDPNVASKIEGECLALAEKKIKESGNESYDFFSTGIASISNHYKKSSVMAGAIQNPHTKKIEILKGNYMDGVSPEEYNKLSMLTIIGGYSRGVETELGGVERKKFANAMQGVKIKEGLDDCGTDLTIRVTLEENISSLFLYRYIVDNGKLVQLTDKNLKDYVGKEVLLRSPLCCKAEGGYCRKCCGDFFSKLGVSNVGLFNNDMAGTLMNASMKAFHDSTLKFTRINIKDYIRKR